VHPDRFLIDNRSRGVLGPVCNAGIPVQLFLKSEFRWDRTNTQTASLTSDELYPYEGEVQLRRAAEENMRGPFPSPPASRSRPDNQRDGRLTGEASTAATYVRTLSDLSHADRSRAGPIRHEQTMAPLMTRVAVGRMRRADADDGDA
jgi:hypothetical protein